MHPIVKTVSLLWKIFKKIENFIYIDYYIYLMQHYNKEQVKFLISDINFMVKLEKKFKLEYIYDKQKILNYTILLNNEILPQLLLQIQSPYSYYFLLILSLYSNDLITFINISSEYFEQIDNKLTVMILCIKNKNNYYIDHLDSIYNFNNKDRIAIYLASCLNDNVYTINKYFTVRLFEYNNYNGIKLISKVETLKYFLKKVRIDKTIIDKLFEDFSINGKYNCVTYLKDNYDVNFNYNQIRSSIDTILNVLINENNFDINSNNLYQNYQNIINYLA